MNKPLLTTNKDLPINIFASYNFDEINILYNYLKIMGLDTELHKQNKLTSKTFKNNDKRINLKIPRRSIYYIRVPFKSRKQALKLGINYCFENDLDNIIFKTRSYGKTTIAEIKKSSCDFGKLF